ncbi:TRAP transporter small permease [Celerinatantimonas yamalensis]|uniref:TRAP transporter small permease protein n=1 Tax=Celerinatantimonas yamalensis TaxID=559956 RepID=A0ABW9G948_9GAMM
MVTQSDQTSHRGQTGPFRKLETGCAQVAKWAGLVSGTSLILLSVSIIMGIALRVFKLDNSWTYDLDLFCLLWLAFIGAVSTALHGRHVNAGIALEHLIGRGQWLMILRFLIIIGFLIVFALSGYRLTIDSIQTHEITLDVVQWPVWIAEIAIPIGASLWGIAELYKFLRDWRQSSSNKS